MKMKGPSERATNATALVQVISEGRWKVMGERATRQETWSVEASKASGHAQTFLPFLPCISAFEQQQKSVDGLRDQL